MSDDRSEGAFDESDIASLAVKLAALELSEREQAALRALLSDEVAGYGGIFDVAGRLGNELTNLREQGSVVFGTSLRAGPGRGLRAEPRLPGTGQPRRL